MEEDVPALDLNLRNMDLHVTYNSERCLEDYGNQIDDRVIRIQ